jgi:hypothetical protein
VCASVPLHKRCVEDGAASGYVCRVLVRQISCHVCGGMQGSCAGQLLRAAGASWHCEAAWDQPAHAASGSSCRSKALAYTWAWAAVYWWGCPWH